MFEVAFDFRNSIKSSTETEASISKVQNKIGVLIWQFRISAFWNL